MHIRIGLRFHSRDEYEAIGKVQKYISKTDGASNYTSAVSWLALRVLHVAKPEWPRCLESLTSRKGDGKIGNDRFHAEIAAKKKGHWQRA